MEEIKPKVGPICKNVLTDDFYLKVLKVSLNLFVSQIATALKKKNPPNLEFKSE